MTTNVFADAAMHIAETGDGVVKLVPSRTDGEVWSAIRDVEDSVKAPGRGVSRVELERVADVYRENLDSSPTRAVMQVMGYSSERTAARRVKQAREADPPLLPPTTPGKRKA